MFKTKVFCVKLLSTWVLYMHRRKEKQCVHSKFSDKGSHLCVQVQWIRPRKLEIYMFNHCRDDCFCPIVQMIPLTRNVHKILRNTINIWTELLRSCFFSKDWFWPSLELYHHTHVLYTCASFTFTRW